MNRKLEGWESDDELEAKRAAKLAATGGVAKQTKTVVLRHMFTLEELASDPTLLLELKEDVREECETLGKVTNVVLYDVSSRTSISIGCTDVAIVAHSKNRMAS